MSFTYPKDMDTEPEYEEKIAREAKVPADIHNDEGEEEEDIDTLIVELESVDGVAELNTQESHQTGRLRPIADNLLQTDPMTGLDETEAILRRKRFGSNEMKEEKENLALKFVSFFVGPVQFVMEVRTLRHEDHPIIFLFANIYAFRLQPY